MKRLIVATTCLFIVAVALTASAEWRVDIADKTVWVGETDISVDVTAYWDIGLAGFTVPVIVREIDPGAFWAGSLPYDTGGNAYIHPYIHGVTWNWTIPWAALTLEFRPGVLQAPCVTGGDTGYDGVAPDHFCINASGTGTGDPPQPSGHVVVTYTFDVNNTMGDFEFDTACFTGSLPTIYMIDENFPPVNHGPSGTGECSFNKGIISIIADSDDDGIPDNLDNCPLVANPNQENGDADDFGDACDNCPITDNPDQANSDTDSWGDACDNCRLIDNPNQTNSDADEFGDACDNCPDVDNPDQQDSDGDLRGDVCDNCPDDENPAQGDGDGDGIGDVCDDCTDSDDDGFGDPGYADNTCATDNCPAVYNPGQEDYDGDGLGDACDNCTDTDGDGFGNAGFPNNNCGLDNCPDEYNPGQADADGDGLGDACDDCVDSDGDGYGDPDYPENVCAVDNCPTVFNPEQADSNGDGKGDACDCECAGYGDLNQDGLIDPIDVALLVRYVFMAQDFFVPIETCPHLPGDWDCDYSRDPLDVIFCLHYVYRAMTYGYPCDPCEDLPPALPDLKIYSYYFKLMPDTIQAGESTYMEVKVYNGGYTMAYNAVLELFEGDPSAGGVLLWSHTITSLNANQVTTRGHSHTFSTAGEREIYAIVDRLNQIEELSETNNKAHKTLVVTE